MGQLTVEADDGLADPLIVVSGELDASTVTILDGPLRSAVWNDHAEVIVDFRQVTFCDVAGLNLLADVSTRLRDGGGQLTVHGPCPALQILLDTLGPAAPIEITPAPPS